LQETSLVSLDERELERDDGVGVDTRRRLPPRWRRRPRATALPLAFTAPRVCSGGGVNEPASCPNVCASATDAAAAALRLGRPVVVDVITRRRVSVVVTCSSSTTSLWLISSSSTSSTHAHPGAGRAGLDSTFDLDLNLGLATSARGASPSMLSFWR
jgi:hypothetical protein